MESLRGIVMELLMGTPIESLIGTPIESVAGVFMKSLMDIDSFREIALSGVSTEELFAKLADPFKEPTPKGSLIEQAGITSMLSEKEWLREERCIAYSSPTVILKDFPSSSS